MAAGTMYSKNKKGIAEWTGLFPDEFKTEKQSFVFVKRMMSLAVSSITYLRGIFPENAYKSRYIEDLCIKVLRDDGSSPGADKIVKWMMGCFDALERRYLHIVFIGVHTNPDHLDRIIESYIFKFRYTEQGPEMDILRNKNTKLQVTMEDTKKASVLLIRKLFLLTENLGTLPNDVCLSMRLYYYDDITPADYEPPGFKEGTCDQLWFEGMAVYLKVGEVQTPFNNVRVCVAIEKGRSEKLRANCQSKSEPGSVESQSVLPQIARIQHPDGDDNFPSEDESAQFKKPWRPVAKRKLGAKYSKKRRTLQ